MRLPLVLAELEKIGSWVKHHNYEASIRAKTDDMHEEVQPVDLIPV
jgi:hypothetical protein